MKRWGGGEVALGIFKSFSMYVPTTKDGHRYTPHRGHLTTLGHGLPGRYCEALFGGHESSVCGQGHCVAQRHLSGDARICHV